MMSGELKGFINNPPKGFFERTKREINRGKFLLKHKKHIKDAKLKGFCPDNDRNLTSISLTNGYEFEINDEEFDFLPIELQNQIEQLALCVKAWEEENRDTIEEDFYSNIA